MQIESLGGLGLDQSLVLDRLATKETEGFAALLEKAKNTGEATGSQSKKDEKLMEACEELCSFFVSYILRQMRETIPESGLFSQSAAGKVYEEMFDSEIAAKIAKSGSFDLPSVLYEQLKQG